MRDREYYLALRNRYQPDDVRCIFIAEAPPCSGLYFYDATGKIGEPLFAAMMKVLGFAAPNKHEGLVHFQRRGFLLVDATYAQVDRGYTGKRRDEKILSDFPLFLKDLSRVNPDKKIPLILVKANICKLLEPKLTEHGFRVLNNGATIPYPASGQQNVFHEKVGNILATL